MKQLYIILLYFSLLLGAFKASAQNNYEITGTVTDDNGAPLKSATVFISGSQKITICDDSGHYRFNHITPGNYQLTVTMLGFSPFSENIAIKNKSADIDVKLKIKSTELAQVNVGGKDHWDNYYKVFKQLFLGKSKNGKACIIVNPKVIHFSTNKGILYADADEFLIIENPRLGYRIKYLLKNFGYNTATDLTLYNGNTSFEPMQGTPRQQAKWDKNRLDTYKGSVMHFLRAIYENHVLKEGFIINPVLGEDNYYVDPKIYYDDRPVNFDTLVSVIDTSFISLKFKKVLFNYSPDKAASISTNRPYVIRKIKRANRKLSTITLHSSEAIIDRTGAHGDFRDFLIEGKLANARVGDQLPFEYQPPAK